MAEIRSWRHASWPATDEHGAGLLAPQRQRNGWAVLSKLLLAAAAGWVAAGLASGMPPIATLDATPARRTDSFVGPASLPDRRTGRAIGIAVRQWGMADRARIGCPLVVPWRRGDCAHATWVREHLVILDLRLGRGRAAVLVRIRESGRRARLTMDLVRGRWLVEQWSLAEA
jgi:hypothetical protein